MEWIRQDADGSPVQAASCDSGVGMQEGGLRWSVAQCRRRHVACQQLCVRVEHGSRLHKCVTCR